MGRILVFWLLIEIRGKPDFGPYYRYIKKLSEMEYRYEQPGTLPTRTPIPHNPRGVQGKFPQETLSQTPQKYIYKT